jgi:hypothetical protein
MKHRALFLSILTCFAASSIANSQNARHGSITFRNVQGSAYSQNLTTGLTDTVSEQSLLSQGFKISTEADAFLDLIFSNGIIARLAPASSLEISHFSTTSNRGTPQAGSSLGAADFPMLEIKLLSGEILINAESKLNGRLLVVTERASIEAEPTKFLVAHGSQAWEGTFATRAVNLGNAPITVSSMVAEPFVEPNQSDTTYGIYDVSEQQRTRFVGKNETAIILDPSPSGQSPEVPPALRAQTLAPLDECHKDQLAQVADYLLNQGRDPFGQAIVVYAGPDATYLNINTGETGTLKPE